MISAILKLIEQIKMNREEEKFLLTVFRHNDKDGEGDMKMDQIREVYSNYQGRFVEK